MDLTPFVDKILSDQCRQVRIITMYPVQIVRPIKLPMSNNLEENSVSVNSLELCFERGQPHNE